MAIPRFQFTLQRLMWAIVWLSVTFAGWGYPFSPRFGNKFVDLGIVLLFGTLGPMLAAVAIFGRRWLAAILAIIFGTAMSSMMLTIAELTGYY